MRKRQGGQAFILVLILLAIGALLVVPVLSLISTSLKSSQIVTRQVKAMHAAEGAQEYVLWKLAYDGFGSEFTVDGQEITLQCDVCGVPVDVTVIMRAVEGKGAICLATDDTIRPTKMVSPDTVPNDTYTTFTYTIRLEQLSDNTTQGLDVVYDILPDGFLEEGYISGSSYLRVDGGSWQPLDDPLIEVEATQVRLRWPASGNFTSPIRDFAVRQVKELKFQFAGELPDDRVFSNWVVLRVGDVITPSGPQAPINVGNPDDPDVSNEDGLLSVDKTSDPEVILPGVETDIEYTIRMTNMDGPTHHIESITDYLPPEFYYSDNSTSGLTTFDPQLSLENINGVDRWKLLWTRDEFPGGTEVAIASGETLTLTFSVETTKNVSGSYYNEVLVLIDKPVPAIFEDIGISREEYGTAFSWNTGAVMVPAYDSEVEADGITIDANIALIPGGVTISSWQVK